MALPETQADSAETFEKLQATLFELRVRRAWLPILSASIGVIPARSEWASGRMAEINRLAASLDYGWDDIYIGTTYGCTIPRLTETAAGRLRESPDGEPFEEAQITGVSRLDLGRQRSLTIFNLTDLEKEDSPDYALPASNLAFLLQEDAAYMDIVCGDQ